MKITIKHCRKAQKNGEQICAAGIKAFCARHNLSMRDLCGEGIDAEKIIATDDAMALKIVEIARAETEE